ncbi:hypothetical protein LX36DRAFT_21940 [Colletotrichum falcatum]|nr:hypothetical protein LX36DRAFT_21940 [Colletotrichum falcatum]
MACIMVREMSMGASIPASLPRGGIPDLNLRTPQQSFGCHHMYDVSLKPPAYPEAGILQGCSSRQRGGGFVLTSHGFRHDRLRRHGPDRPHALCCSPRLSSLGVFCHFNLHGSPASPASFHRSGCLVCLVRWSTWAPGYPEIRMLENDRSRYADIMSARYVATKGPFQASRPFGKLPLHRWLSRSVECAQLYWP